MFCKVRFLNDRDPASGLVMFLDFVRRAGVRAIARRLGAPEADIEASVEATLEVSPVYNTYREAAAHSFGL